MHFSVLRRQCRYCNAQLHFDSIFLALRSRPHDGLCASFYHPFSFCPPISCSYTLFQCKIMSNCYCPHQSLLLTTPPPSSPPQPHIMHPRFLCYQLAHDCILNWGLWDDRIHVSVVRFNYSLMIYENTLFLSQKTHLGNLSDTIPP